MLIYKRSIQLPRCIKRNSFLIYFWQVTRFHFLFSLLFIDYESNFQFIFFQFNIFLTQKLSAYLILTLNRLINLIDSLKLLLWTQQLINSYIIIDFLIRYYSLSKTQNLIQCQ